MPRSLFDLTGRIALVTGSSRGIGRELARGLADAGATVVLNGRDPSALDATAASFAAAHGAGRVFASAFDVTDEEATRSAINLIESECGPLDILVNNAGIQLRVPLLDLALADWDRVIRHDLTSAFIVGRAVANGMIARGRGKIINICSVQTDLARPAIAAYTAAKGGLRNLTRAMTAEWAAAGLQINAIAPGYIHTEMTQSLVDDQRFNDWIVGRTPAARWGTPEDLVGPTVWLSSSGSDYVNGQVIFVDGGMTVVVLTRPAVEPASHRRPRALGEPGSAVMKTTCWSSSGTVSTSQWTRSSPARGCDIVFVRWPGRRTGCVSQISVNSSLPVRNSASSAASPWSPG